MLTTKKNLNVNHVVLLDVLRAIILGTIENYIARLHLMKLQFDWQCIILVSLITWSKLETEFIS